MQPMRLFRPLQPWVLCLALLAGMMMIGLAPAFSQDAGTGMFPQDRFTQLYPTLPNEELDFTDGRDSCCAGDYVPTAKTPSGRKGEFDQSPHTNDPAVNSLPKSAFEAANPTYSAISPFVEVVACDVLADLPEQASTSGERAPTHIDSATNLPLKTNSINTSQRKRAQFFTDPRKNNTNSFHITTKGGLSLVQLQDVNNYSVCMARGGNIAMVANTDNGSIHTYNGNDHIYIAGHNTNMLTRTGAGDDIIEIYQARPHAELASAGSLAGFQNEQWQSYNIYKTAISGSEGLDTLRLQGTPWGTKWCYIGGYTLYGEYFYVVEFALPPSVNDGPRRQRISIGRSVEYVEFKGKRYLLREFLVHGAALDQTARSVPIEGDLPRVKTVY